jgi:adenylate cyclase
MLLRIGIHFSDVLLHDGDLVGDDVNIAARLQRLAPPGGNCVSGAARDHLGKRLPIEFIDIGEQPVKNIAEPVRLG